MSQDWSKIAKVRCFVAVDTPPALKEQVSQLISRMRVAQGGQKLKWVKPDGVHLTLKFLGNVPSAKVTEIEAAVTAAINELSPAAFDLSLGGLGRFGKPDAPRVIWLGVEGNKTALNKLQQTVEKALNPLGFPPENRPYSPHLTLARVPEFLGREERNALVRLLERYTGSPEVQFGNFSIDEVVLMESDRRPDGAVYTPIIHFPFHRKDEG
jgi:2'-5' RNA ligase